MKSLLFIVLFSMVAGIANAQHYYNDLVITGDNIKKRAAYQLQKVKAVTFASFDSYNQPIEGFSCNQQVKNNFTQIITVTKTALTGITENTSFFNAAGQLIKSVDTSEGNRTVINYTYTGNNIAAINSQSFSPGNYINTEQHLWYYTSAGKPGRMLKIKNGSDTTYIRFELDEQGNVAEEKSTHRGQAQPTVYYYYDDQNRLTDIVRYNNRAKKLLPDYIFEYNAQNRLSTMLVTTEGTGDYQKWYYTYDDKGLKIKDECFSKTRVLIGKIEYQYQF